MADETLTRREDTRQKLEKSTTCSGNTKDTQSFADLTDASRKTARGKTRAFLFCIVRRGHGVTKERKAAEKARRPRPSAPDRARGVWGVLERGPARTDEPNVSNSLRTTDRTGEQPTRQPARLNVFKELRGRDEDRRGAGEAGHDRLSLPTWTSFWYPLDGGP